MDQEKFGVLLPYISERLVAMIAEKQNISELDAFNELYGSQLYGLLEREDTKVWYYSTDMLYHLLMQEKETGSIDFPDV